MPRSPKERLLAARSAAHRAVFARSRGRLLAVWGGHQVLLLTTTGRRTGASRHTMVAALLVVGDTIAVAASDGGAPRHPAWYLNLRADPGVEVVFRGRRTPMRARTATAAEKADLWPRMTAAAPAYARYQRRTARDIPVVLLEPR